MKVVSKQTNSKMCIICGLENSLGVKADFYNMEDGSVGAKFKFRKEHQSYPERVHGGMVSALLDELAGRALWVTDPEHLGVTANMSVKFRKPVPYDKTLLAKGYITKRSSRIFSAEAQIFDEDKSVLAQLSGNYVILPNEQISSCDNLSEEVSIFVKDNVTELDI